MGLCTAAEGGKGTTKQGHNPAAEGNCILDCPVRPVTSAPVPCTAQVIECQAAVCSVASCSAQSAVTLLWCLAVSGALMLELWDALAVALDRPGVGLEQQQLQQVRE